ncbi:MAG: cell division protein FtsL [Burkholderiales bacterium]|nr:cell division protein FtsL [Burkholderiales bacterium]
MRLNLLLLVALLASSLVLVHTAYESRRLFSALDRERAQARALAVEHQRLQAERQLQAAPARVEQVARARLGMRMATPAVTEYVVDPLASQGQGASR